MFGIGKIRQGRFVLTVFLVLLFLAACSQPASQTSPQSSKNPEAKPEKEAGQKPSEQKPKISTLQDIAMYQGDDREKILLDNAKKEGALTVYAVMPVEDMKVITDAFEKKYGIKVNVWRSGSESVLQRVLQETKSGRYEVDLLDNNGSELEAMHREGILQKIVSPYHKELVSAALPPHGEWVGTRINVFTQAYNTKLVKKEDIPKKYEDLLDPKWKGKLAIEAEDMDWLAAISKEFGEQKMTQLFKNIVATNGISVRKGHTLLTQLVATGEVPFALTVYNYKAAQLKKQGAPIEWYAIEPAMARPNGIAIPKKVPHPFAAILFYDFILSDAQEILAKRSVVPTNKKVDTDLNKMPLKFVDPVILMDEYEKWNKLFNEIIIQAGSTK